MTHHAPGADRPRQIADFIAKWGPGGAAYALNEEQGAQQHFLELCALLGVAPPGGGDDYLFEKGTRLLGQRRGYADVFKRGCFAWRAIPSKGCRRAFAMRSAAISKRPIAPDSFACISSRTSCSRREAAATCPATGWH